MSNDAQQEDSARRLRALLEASSITARQPPAVIDEAYAQDPLDLSSFYALSGGVELRDGTKILGREEAARATAWLIDEKSLQWDRELLLLGERDDLVIVRDPDRRGARAGGGVL